MLVSVRAGKQANVSTGPHARIAPVDSREPNGRGTPHEAAASPVWSETEWLTVVRLLFVLLQGASILITWPLWQTRANPPLLPVLDSLPQVDLGFLLLGTLVLVSLRPTAGVLLHVATLLIAFALDQTRLQPEFVSLAIMLVGTTRIPYARVIAGAHLLTLWFWAGLNKALSLGFMSESAPWLFDASPIRPGFLRPYFGWLIIAAEISVALFLLLPRLRRAGMVLAVGLHSLVLVSLVRVGWNESVWPWNIALAIAAPAFFARLQRNPSDRRGVSLLIFFVFAVTPIGFYGGYVDTYIAHNLYTGNTARAEVCQRDGTCSGAIFHQTWPLLRVPLPPEFRLFVDYFNELCSPGERLVMHPRRAVVAFGRDRELAVHSCPSPRS